MDDRLGVDGSFTRHAKRLICLAGASWGYHTASKNLRELSGLTVSGGSVRNISQAEGAKMSRWRRESPESAEAFQKSDGRVEFTTDGTCVNTMDGWREMRVGIFSKRKKGEPASVENWDSRELPTPHVRRAIASVETAERFTSRWRRWGVRLGIRDSRSIDVLADGAPWIWDAASMHFAGCSGCLDIYHALEHVADAAKGLFQESENADAWADSAKHALLMGGWPGMFDLLCETRREVSRGRWKNHGRPLYNYLARRAEQLNYPERLAAGLPIGSGQVEGACKNLVGRRLKQTGARWRIRRLNRMASLCSLVYSDLWDQYWTSSA